MNLPTAYRTMKKLLGPRAYFTIDFSLTDCGNGNDPFGEWIIWHNTTKWRNQELGAAVKAALHDLAPPPPPPVEETIAAADMAIAPFIANGQPQEVVNA